MQILTSYFYYDILEINFKFNHFVAGMTKLLVGVGESRKGLTDTIEVIDLKSPASTCRNLPNFPVAISGAIGGLGFQDKPIICGGLESNNYFSNKCYSLTGNEWVPLPSLNTPRSWAAISQSPYPSKSQKFFVTGGKEVENALLNTAEVLTEQGWKTLPQLLSSAKSSVQHLSIQQQ